jgi:hypothetical protein
MRTVPRVRTVGLHVGRLLFLGAGGILAFEERPMKTAVLALILTSLAGGVIAHGGRNGEHTLAAFNAHRQRVQRIGMIILAGWAGLNIVGGTTLYFLDEANRYFHQMNAIWNVVNAALATGGILGSRKDLSDWSLTRSIEAQHNLEKVYVLNAGLDLGYIMGGLFLAQLGDDYPARAVRFEGWGASIAVQGAFLMVFDAVMFLVHRRNRGYRTLVPSPATEPES